MKWNADDFIVISKICETLGEPFSKFLIGIHSFREEWITLFLKCDSNIIHALTQIPGKVTESIFKNIEKMVCSIYCTLEPCTDDLPSLKYRIFWRNSANSNLANSSSTAFMQTGVTFKQEYRTSLWQRNGSYRST